MTTMSVNNTGSEWNRWDLHIHTPGTGLADKYNCSMADFIERLNKAPDTVIALGITDYYSIENYKYLYAEWKQDKLPKIKLLLPNVELRLAINTENSTGLNVHVIFSNNDSDFISIIESNLTRLNFKYQDTSYNCSRQSIIRLGAAVDKSLVSEQQKYQKGLENFKIDFTEFDAWYHDSWIENNTIVAVSGKSTDGTDALNPTGGFAAIRDNIQKLAHIIFSAAPSDINYWLGCGTDTEEIIISKYKSLKLCIIGCDAHSLDTVLKPADNKYCWIKAEPTFDGLKQIIYEPKYRVHIGEEQPELNRENCISSISIWNKSWFPQKQICLNKGLVSIIGARGSGKTALLDFIAVGMDTYAKYNASFLQKAEKKVEPLTVDINIDGKIDHKPFSQENNIESPKARYLSQQFVESLCLNEGSSEKLISEIEGFIFANIDAVDRQGTTSFSELREILCGGLDTKINTLQEQVKAYSREITRIYRKQTVELNNKKQAHDKTEFDIQSSQRKLPKLDKTELSHSLSLFDTLNSEKSNLAKDLKTIQLQKKMLEDVYTEMIDLNKTIIDKNEVFKKVLSDNGIPENSLKEIDIQYPLSLLLSIEKSITNRQTDFQIKYGI